MNFSDTNTNIEFFQGHSTIGKPMQFAMQFAKRLLSKFSTRVCTQSCVRDQAGQDRPGPRPRPRPRCIIEPRFSRYCFLTNSKYE